MTKVDVGFAAEELQFERVGEESVVPNMSQLVDNDNFNHKIMCMDTTQTDIISALDNSSGPIRFSILKENRWKPYEREKQRLEEQNTRRAILVKKELLRRGLSLSPFYVPHFDDHRLDIDEVEKILRNRHGEVSWSSEEKIATGIRHRQISSGSEEFSSSPDEDDETTKVCFEDSNKEYVGKTNQDLVKELIEAEDKLEELRKAFKMTKLHKQFSELEKIRVYREEIEKLTKENNHLLSENRKLHSILSDAD